MKILKNRIFLVLATAIIVGSITAYATISPNSGSILYDNTVSGLESTNMQDAIDELYTKASSLGNGSSGIVLPEYEGALLKTSIKTAQTFEIETSPDYTLVFYYPGYATVGSAVLNSGGL